MTEEIKQEGNGVEEESNVETQPDANEVIEQLKAELGHIKKAQAGSDKKNAELKAQLQEAIKAQLSTEERIKYEQEEHERSIKEREERLLMAERQNMVNDFILENNLDPKCKKLLNGSSIDELQEQAIVLQSIIEEAIKKTDDAWLKKSGLQNKGTAGNNFTTIDPPANVKPGSTEANLELLRKLRQN